MFAGSRRLLLKLSFVVALVVFVLSFQPNSATASCSGYELEPGTACSQSCYDRVYCQAIECFQSSWAQGGNGEECCFWNNSARFCGPECPLFCAEPCPRMKLKDLITRYVEQGLRQGERTPAGPLSSRRQISPPSSKLKIPPPGWCSPWIGRRLFLGGGPGRRRGRVGGSAAAPASRKWVGDSTSPSAASSARRSRGRRRLLRGEGLAASQ